MRGGLLGERRTFGRRSRELLDGDKRVEEGWQTEEAHDQVRCRRRDENGDLPDGRAAARLSNRKGCLRGEGERGERGGPPVDGAGP